MNRTKLEHSRKGRREEEWETSFDPDLRPDSEHNRRAAEDRRLQYDPRERVYKDEDGCPRFDEYGQSL